MLKSVANLIARSAASLTTLNAQMFLHAALKSSRCTQVSTAAVRNPRGRFSASNKLIDRGVMKFEMVLPWKVSVWFGDRRRTGSSKVCGSCRSAFAIAVLSCALMSSQYKDNPARCVAMKFQIKLT